MKKIPLVILGLVSIAPLSFESHASDMITYDEAINSKWADICSGARGELSARCLDTTSLSTPLKLTFSPIDNDPNDPQFFTDLSLAVGSVSTGAGVGSLSTGAGVGSNTGTSAGLATSTHLSDQQYKKNIKDRLNKLKETTENYSSIKDRLGFFMNGETNQTEQIETRFENGYDSDLAKFTAGVDYFFTDKFIAGFIIGYSNTDIDFIGGSETELNSVSTILYGSYAITDHFSIDSYAGWAGGDFDIKRQLSYKDIVANTSASTNSDKVLAGIATSYSFNINSFSITPRLKFDYTQTFIDSYNESGGKGLALHYKDQEITTLQTDIGVDATYAWSLPWGVILPRVGVSYVHEFSNDSRLIRTSFILDDNSTEIAFNTNNPERDYMLTSAGISAVLPQGIQAFISYERTDFHRYFKESYTVSGGLRIDL